MFTVTIITKRGENTLTEKAGSHGERVILSFAGPKGIKINPKPRKIEGWKTRKGALNYISECLLKDVKNGSDSWYQIETA